MLPTSGPLKPSTTISPLSTHRSLLGAPTTLLLPPTLQCASAVFVEPTGGQTGLVPLPLPPTTTTTTNTTSITINHDFYGSPFIYQNPLNQQPFETSHQNESTSTSTYLMGIPSAHLDSSPLYPHHLPLSTSKSDRFGFSSFESVQSIQSSNNFPGNFGNDVKTFPLLEDIEMFLEEEKRSKSEERNTTPTSDDYSTSSEEQQVGDNDGRTPKRREKKKQQNREAATRYREKKRKERQEAKQKEDTLRHENQQLRTKMTEIQAEIDYLKRLMHEIGMDDDHIKYISPVVPL